MKMRDFRRLLVLLFLGYRSYRRMKKQTLKAMRAKATELKKGKKPAPDVTTTAAE